MIEYRMPYLPWRRRASSAALILSFALLSACGGGVKIGAGMKKVVSEDFAEGRAVDLSIAEKLTGSRDMLFMSVPKKAEYLEGYIQGVITDYQDNPIQGVVVRGVAVGEAQGEETGGRQATGIVGSSFDPGVSDTNGFYRIRFSLPIINNIVDVRGRILYSPGWEQEKENLGKAYEPQTKQSQFRLYFERKRGRITFTEGIRKTIVAGVNSGGPGKIAPAAAAKPAVAEKEKSAAEKPAEPAGGGEDDLFKGFGFGQ